MLRKCAKKFSTAFSSQKNINNINSLNKYLMANFQNLKKEEFVAVLNKFQEFEAKEPNAKLKLYDILDYVLYDEKNLSDNNLMKTVMRTMLAVGMYDKMYWDHFKKIILKNNLLFNTEYNFFEYLKIYSIVNYEDDEIWRLFEEYFLEMNRSFDTEQIQSVALCFGNNKKGSKQFWLTLFETYDLKNTKYPDFILNFSVCLCGFLQSKIISKIDQKLVENFCTYLNFSSEFLHKNILHGAGVEKIDVVYSLFPHFHKSYHIDQIHIKFPDFMEKNILKSFIDNLEIFLKNYLDKNINKLEDEDFEQISKILKYSVDNQIHFHKLKPIIFVKIFTTDITNIKNYEDIFNFLNFFNFHNIKEEKLKEAFNEDSTWERFIDVMHLMSLDQLIKLTVIMKNYNVKYFRIWIFVQNFFKLHIKNMLMLSEENLSNLQKINNKTISSNFNGEEAVLKIEKILEIFNDETFKFEEFVFLPFIIFLQTSRDKLNIQNSYAKLEFKH